MTRIYEIPIDRLEADPIKISEILYDGAPLNVRKTRMKEEKIKKGLEKIKKIYLPSASPVGYSRSVDPNLVHNIFSESLPQDSPVFKALDEWRETAIFIVSIGSLMEDSVLSLQKTGRLFDALLLDTFSSVLVDSLAEIVMNDWAGPILEKVKNPEKFYPMRYSPGYCMWDVKGQIELFGYMADMELPVSLTPGLMMFPRKSISGLLVIEKFSGNSKLSASCRVCDKKCRYMRAISRQVLKSRPYQ